MRNNPELRCQAWRGWHRNNTLLSLGTGHHWHTPSPWTGCPTPIVCRGQAKDDKKQMETLAPGVSLRTPAASQWLSCCELHFWISSTALPCGCGSLAPVTLMESSLPSQPPCSGPDVLFLSSHKQKAFLYDQLLRIQVWKTAGKWTKMLYKWFFICTLVFAHQAPLLAA